MRHGRLPLESQKGGIPSPGSEPVFCWQFRRMAFISPMVPHERVTRCTRIFPYLGGNNAQETQTAFTHDDLFVRRGADFTAQRLWRDDVDPPHFLWWHASKGRHLD